MLAKEMTANYILLQLICTEYVPLVILVSCSSPMAACWGLPMVAVHYISCRG